MERKNLIPTVEDFQKNEIYHFSDANVISDFSSFYKGKDWNRDINNKHVNDIKKAILSGSVIDPIRVSLKTHTVVDGNHRLAAYRELWKNNIECELDVLFVDYENDDKMLDEIRILNNNQKSWTGNDYFEFYGKKGDETSSMISDFAEEHYKLCHRKNGEINIRNTTCLLFGSGVNPKNIGNVKKDVDLEFSHKIAKELEIMLEKLCGPKRNVKLSNWVEDMIKVWFWLRKDIIFEDEFKSVGGFYKFNKRFFTLTRSWKIATSKEIWKNNFRDSLDQMKRY